MITINKFTNTYFFATTAASVTKIIEHIIHVAILEILFDLNFTGKSASLCTTGVGGSCI